MNVNNRLILGICANLYLKARGRVVLPSSSSQANGNWTMEARLPMVMAARGGKKYILAGRGDEWVVEVVVVI